MTKIDEVIRAAADRLAAAGVASPRHDAEELAGHVLGLSRTGLLLLERLPPSAAERYAELVEQRAARVPLQHLTGVAGFRRLELAVGPGVFVPRPETEVLVEWALSRLGPGALVVDLCAGSGAVALAIADEAAGRDRARGRDRPVRAGVGRAQRRDDRRLPVTLHRGDVTDPAVLAELAGTVDLVTANPPYIPLGATVEPEVAEHDPPAALWGGPDGLDVVRAVERAAARLLRPGGLVAVEHADVAGGVGAGGLRPRRLGGRDRPPRPGRPPPLHHRPPPVGRPLRR